MSVPSKVTLPPVGSSSRVTRRAVVLLPQPDSPTIENVSPRRTSKSTPSTAWTALVDLRQEAAADREVLDQALDLEQVSRSRSGVRAACRAGVGVSSTGVLAACLVGWSLASLGEISSRPDLLALGGRDVAGDEVLAAVVQQLGAVVRQVEPTRSAGSRSGG